MSGLICNGRYLIRQGTIGTSYFTLQLLLGIKLFCSQAFDRVTRRRLYRQEAHRPQRDQQRGHAGQHEHPPADSNPIRIILHPPMERQPCQRPGDQIGDQHQPDKMFGQQEDDILYGGAQDLADPDLLGPLLRGKGGQTKQTQAGDEDGQAGHDTPPSGRPGYRSCIPL